MTRTLLVLIAIAAVPAAAAAEPARAWHVSAEGDIARIALGSLSAHVMVRPPGAPRLRLGIGRVGGALPAVFHTLFDPNDGGWEVTEQGGVAQAFVHLRARGSTLFAGGYVRFERWRWRRHGVAGDDTGAQVFVMPAIGYRWFPRATGLYVAPWLGLGVSVWNDGAGEVDGHTYDPLRWFPIAAIHVGYEG